VLDTTSFGKRSRRTRRDMERGLYGDYVQFLYSPSLRGAADGLFHLDVEFWPEGRAGT
jgi:hypothetical protein